MQNQKEANASGQEKVLKKIDKILPCPRCNSMNTKFCYYNNYNVNQPWHFCKGCQRYWTAGGAMRNVPIGAGRRKGKHSASHCRDIMKSSDGMACNKVDAPDSSNHQTIRASLSATVRPLMGNEHVGNCGLEAPLCESMNSVLNLGDQKRNAEFGSACGENKEELSCTTSISASKSVENGLPEPSVNMKQNEIQGSPNGLIPLHLQCYFGPPWPYPWAPGWTNVASMPASLCSPELVPRPENGGPIPVPWFPPLMASPTFCPTVPFPFVPAAFWGGLATCPNGTLSVPVTGSNGGLSPPSCTSNSAFSGNSSPALGISCTSNSALSGNSSPALGKRSRDTDLQGEEDTEKSL